MQNVAHRVQQLHQTKTNPATSAPPTASAAAATADIAVGPRDVPPPRLLLPGAAAEPVSAAVRTRLVGPARAVHAARRTIRYGGRFDAERERPERRKAAARRAQQLRAGHALLEQPIPAPTRR